MNMRLWSFRVLCISMLLLCTGFLHAQSVDWLKSLPRDTVQITDQRTKDKRVHIKYSGTNSVRLIKMVIFVIKMAILVLFCPIFHGFAKTF